MCRPLPIEEAWGHLTRAAADVFAPRDGWPAALIIAPWPLASGVGEAIDADAEKNMDLIIELIRAIRNVRSEYGVQPGRRIAALFAAGEETDLLTAEQDILIQLARIDANQLTIQPAVAAPAQVASIVAGGVTCYLPLANLIDLEAERLRLNMELDRVLAAIARSEKQLAGPFAQRAPADVVQREREKLADLMSRQAQLEERLGALN